MESNEQVIGQMNVTVSMLQTLRKLGIEEQARRVHS